MPGSGVIRRASASTSRATAATRSSRCGSIVISPLRPLGSSPPSVSAGGIPPGTASSLVIGLTAYPTWPSRAQPATVPAA